MRCLFGTVAVMLVGVACGGTAVGFPDGSGGAGAGTVATTTTSSGSGVAGGSSGPTCDFQPEAGVLCVRGEPSANGETLRAGGPVTFEVFPEGCFSSSCTDTITADCSVVGEAVGELVVSSEFCLHDTSANSGGCTEDCGGAGVARCDVPAIREGRYTVTLGDIELMFNVPSELPSSGLCAGEQ